MAQSALKREGEHLVLIGAETGHLGQSLYMDIVLDKREGGPPPVDLDAERRTGDFVRKAIGDKRLSAVHDVSDGGLLIAVAEMALSGGIGCSLEAGPDSLPAHAAWFGEDQARYVVAVSDEACDGLLQDAADAGIPARKIGQTGGDSFSIAGEESVALEALQTLQQVWLPNYMGIG